MEKIRSAAMQPSTSNIPSAAPVRREGTPACGIWRGHVLVPAIGGGWLRREVHLPTTVVESYTTMGDFNKPCDERSVVVEQVDRWLRDPDLITRFLGAK